MFKAKKLDAEVKIYVTDKCNLHCAGCHWFSEAINEGNTITKKDILFFIKKWRPPAVCFTGGEPTLWPHLSETVNAIPLETQVWINTNGSIPESIEALDRSVYIRLSRHKKTNAKKFEKTLAIAKNKGFAVYIVTFDNPLPGVIVFANQLNIRDDDARIGKQVKCKPCRIYFGSDGNAYYCERGLRSKNPDLRMGFSLRHGKPRIKSKVCKADKFCLTASGEYANATRGGPEQEMVFLN